MRIKWIYFILIVFLQACKGNVVQKTDTYNTSLYPEPLTVALDTIKGYRLNPITGDSIKPLFNSFGDRVKTGISFSFIGTITDSVNTTKPFTSKAATLPKMFIESNVHPLPKKLTIITVDTTKLKLIKSGKPTLLTATGIIMPFRESHPVKALPLRFKDNATANVQYLDVDQGMSVSYVYAMLEDKRGNFWLGTDGAGLGKYDGVTFSHYGKKDGLSSNSVICLLLDKNGNIWIGTEDGLNYFDGKNFTQYKGILPADMIYSIMKDKGNNIWFSTNTGLMKYDGTQFLNYTVKEGLPSDTVNYCIEDSKGNIWIGTNRGAVKFDGENFTLYTVKDGLLYDNISSLLEDGSGNIWLSSKMGINKYDGKSITHYTEIEGLSNNIVREMINDRNGNIWIGTSFGGINKYDGKSFTHFSLKEGLSNNKVRSILEDHNGNIWFGTDGGGINKLNDAGFSYLPHNEVLNNNRVRPIIKDKKGNIWFGTEGGGIGKYEAGNFSYFPKKDGANFLGQRSLLEDTTGTIWIGATNGYIMSFTGQYFTDYTPKSENSENTVYDMKQDRTGNIWFAKKEDGISKYDGLHFTNYSEKEGLSCKKVLSLFEDKNGNLWFGTDGAGLCKYDGSRLINYTEREGMFGKSITSIIEDKKGDLWLGTLGAGVCRFNGKNFTYYTEKEGLSNNNVWSLIEDSVGHIWAGTDKGLNRFVQSNNRYVIYNYGLQDGLKALDFNLHSACIDNNNRIWWGTGKNIVIKDLNRPFKTIDVHSLKLSFIEINDQFYDYHNFPDSLGKYITFGEIIPFSNYPAGLKLSYDQNHLNFHFSAIDWSAPDKIKYSYRLIGLDEKWSTPSEETMADYRNLSHGNFLFQVKAIGQSQVWTEPLTYSFIIHPAWWQTLLFKISLIIIIILLSLFISRLIYLSRLSKQRIRLEKQLAVQFERQRISDEMHDDIGAGLSGIRLMTEMTKNKVKDEQTANEVEKIYQSVGNISSKMKEVIWSLNSENDHLSNLITYIQTQARQWLEYYPCRLTIETPEIIPEEAITGEARRNIFLVVKEAVHNIIKHSAADKINIRMTCNGNFTIIVSDNGKGIDTEKGNGTGNGMKNMRKRIQQLNGKFYITNKEGLSLTFEIPLKSTL